MFLFVVAPSEITRGKKRGAGEGDAVLPGESGKQFLRWVIARADRGFDPLQRMVPHTPLQQVLQHARS
jgi:hypothetical protein